jgi:hypothetical protein
MKSTRYIAGLIWLAILCGLGWLDIEIAFRPIATTCVFFLVVGLWFYRHILANLSARLFIDTHLIAIAGIAVASTVAIGMFLNGAVESAALDLVNGVYAYRTAQGQFPTTIAEVRTGKVDINPRRNRLRFGSRFYYLKKDESFSFGYQTFPFGRKFWNVSTKRFDEALD